MTLSFFVGRPCCGSVSRPTIIRDGAKNWYLSNNFGGTVAAIHSFSVSSDDYGIPADWDLDVFDEYVIVS